MGEPSTSGSRRRRGCRRSCCVMLAAGFLAVFSAGALGDPCVVVDDGTGTVNLPPPGCPYLSPQDVHMIINGLPPNTEIILDTIHLDFICEGDPTHCGVPDGLGGENEQFLSTLQLGIRGTGDLATFQRNIQLQPVVCQTHTDPRTPGDAVQSFPTEMVQLQGAIFGDPDFDLLRITAGVANGLPSPGNTTLTRLPSGDFNVDSFFDIAYQIEFIGPGGGSPLAGLSGTTQGTIRMQAGDPIDQTVQTGDDLWTTVQPTKLVFGGNTGGPELGIPPIPAGFFGPGSLPFSGDVPLQGVPLDPGSSDVDTIVRRLGPASLPGIPSSATVPIELIELQLTSIQPIPVGDVFFDVFVTVDPNQPSTGQMTITRNALEGGTFTSQLNVHPRISFIQVGGGPELVLPVPGPIVLENTLTPHPWCFESPTGGVPGAGPNFFPKPPPLTEEEPDGSQHTVLPGNKTFQIEFSVDIGGDTELSDPTPDGNEGFDPGDVYVWIGPPVTPPIVPGGRDGFKDDVTLFTFGFDPFPDPPDLLGTTGAIPGLGGCPIGGGCEGCYGDYFDLDGHDQLDVSLIGVIDPAAPLFGPIPQTDLLSICIYEPRFMAISYDDDLAPGWDVGDVPVTVPSPAGLTYGTTLGFDEVLSVGLAPGFPPLGFGPIVPFADEVGVHLSLAPNPGAIPGDESEDDDVDSLDFVDSIGANGSCPIWFFSPDHEAHFGLDPGSIYERIGIGSVKVIDEIHLGISPDTDIDAFEFTWLPDPGTPVPVFAVLFSVDEDDPCTPGDESGGLDPKMVYASFLTGFSFPLTTVPFDDDVDAISLWCQLIEPQPTGACCVAGLPLDCIVTTVGDCASRGGVYQGDGTTCVDADGNLIADLCEPECVPNIGGTACESFLCPDPFGIDACLPRCIRFNPIDGTQTVVDCDCVDQNNTCFAAFGPVDPVCVDNCPAGQQCERTETPVDPLTGLVDVCCTCVDVPPVLCPEPAGATICASRQATDCIVDGNGVQCEPLCVIILSDGMGGTDAGAQLCDCVDVDGPCGPIEVFETVPNEYRFVCNGTCPPGQTCTVHRGFSGIFTDTGMSLLSVSNPPIDEEFKCFCADDPPPPTCPQPPGQTICAALQPTECLNGAAGDFCVPTCVRMVDDGAGGAQPTAETCVCDDPTPTCGPVSLFPIIGTSDFNLSCNGQDCPPGQICQIHINTIPQGVTNIFSNLLNAGDEVKCGCSGDPGPVCPEPDNSTLCAMLQPTQCLPDAQADVCLPQCVKVGSGPAGPTITATVCDCYPDVAPCDPVQVRQVPGAVGLELFCEGDCPPGANCEITLDGVAQGVSSINAAAVPTDSEVKCECVDEPPAIGACCFDADGDGVSESCAIFTPTECSDRGGTFHGVGTICGVVGSCCYDTDGDGVAESCDVMDSTCCEDLNGTFNGAGSVCMGDMNGNNIDDSCDCDQLTTRRLILRSGNGTVGGLDANISALNGSGSAPLSGSAFTTQFFRKACKRPPADIVNPLAVYLPGSGGILPADPFAQWIAKNQFLSPASQLYCYEFKVCCPDASLSSATIEFAFAGDDRLGDPAGGPNPIGVFINGVPVAGHTGGGFGTQTVFPITPIALNSGSNSLHVYLRDQFSVASAAIFSATIEYECRPEACCFPDGTCDNLDPCCCRDLGGTPAGAGSDCTNTICPQPDCGPLPGGLACAPFNCPVATENCDPRCLAVDPLTGQVRIVDCECRNDNDCHPEVAADGSLSCVGACPAGETCVESVTIDPVTGEQTLCCDCEPAPACEPVPGTPFCNNLGCPVAGEQCRPKCVDFLPGAGTEAVDCDCLTDQDCFVEVPVDGTQPFCVDNCPPGETCRETISVNSMTGERTICCECVPDPTQCEPLPDNSACEPIVCPDPNDVCVPRCIEQHPVFGARVVDCDCREPNECHPVPSTLVPPLSPTCEGFCLPGETCIQSRSFDPLTGAVTVCCDCQPVCPLTTDPAVDPCAALQATDCVSDGTTNGRCRPKFVTVVGGVPVVTQCECAEPQDDCGPIGIDVDVVFCPGGCTPPQQGECLVHANGVSLGSNAVTVSPNLEGAVLTCDCADPPVVGACCFDADGDMLAESCSVITLTECNTLGGMFAGAGTNCGVSGACCVDRDLDGVNDACIAADSTCCEALAGDFQGAGTSCQGDSNNNGIDDICDCELDDAGTVIALRSGNGLTGAPDAEITMLSGPGASPLSAAAFTAADFGAACAGPPARIINPIAAWLPGSFGLLPADPSAKWIGRDPSRSPTSALFCHEFEVCCPDPLAARIEFAFAADDRIGDPGAGPNPIGVYMNGLPVPGFSGGGFGAQTVLGPAPVTVNTGTNRLQVYLRDTLAIVSGLNYSATVTVQCALEACCLPDGTCDLLDPCCCRDLGGTPQGSGSDCTPGLCGGPTCVRDCDCYTDGIAAGTPPDVCDYTYCENNQCVSCVRRHGNTCSSFSAFVGTDDILCAVSGFGNYCACPNADIWNSTAAGCSDVTPANCKGPNGIPISTDDILAIVDAFGGANPFNCPIPPLGGGCDASPPPAAGACGPAAASGVELPAVGDVKSSIGNNDNARFVIVPRQRAVRSGDDVVVDVYVTDASGVVGFEFGLNARMVGKSSTRVAIESVRVESERRDYIFAGLYSFPALDAELGRVGGALYGSGVEIPAGKRSYVGTFTFRVPANATGIVNIAPSTEHVGLWTDGSVRVSADAGKDAVVLIVASERSRR